MSSSVLTSSYFIAGSNKHWYILRESDKIILKKPMHDCLLLVGGIKPWADKVGLYQSVTIYSPLSLSPSYFTLVRTVCTVQIVHNKQQNFDLIFNLLQYANQHFVICVICTFTNHFTSFRTLRFLKTCQPRKTAGARRRDPDQVSLCPPHRTRKGIVVVI